MGCRYRRVNNQFVKNKDFQNRRIARFIYHYHRALIEQDNDKSVIVFTDESYCHNNHALLRSWFCPQELEREVYIPNRTGRFIIFHAITKDGLLNNGLENIGDDLTVAQKSAEYFYRHKIKKTSKKSDVQECAAAQRVTDKSDYHGNIDWDMFYNWITNRLIPAFEEKYPGKKMILAMDNASYHNKPVNDYKCPSAMKKDELKSKLAENNIYYPESALKPELFELWRNYTKARPEIKQTVLAKLFEDKGWELLFTPPSCPRTQPIELVWGMVKDRVARQYTGDRNMDETLEHINHAFYHHMYPPKDKKLPHTPCECELLSNDGNAPIDAVRALTEAAQSIDSNYTRGLNANHCERMIDKCRTWMQNWIDNGNKTIVSTEQSNGPAIKESVRMLAGKLGEHLIINEKIFPYEKQIFNNNNINSEGIEFTYRMPEDDKNLTAAILTTEFQFPQRHEHADDDETDSDDDDNVDFRVVRDFGWTSVIDGQLAL